jgi:cytochrome c-type biogenesis protein CcmH/NrfG
MIVALSSFLILAVLITLAVVLSSSQYSAVASGVQAIAVIPAITIAALALTRDNRGKRVDRVLDFHREFNSGEIQKAAVRLTAHLREHGTDGRRGRCRVMSCAMILFCLNTA